MGWSCIIHILTGLPSVTLVAPYVPGLVKARNVTQKLRSFIYPIRLKQEDSISIQALYFTTHY